MFSKSGVKRSVQKFQIYKNWSQKYILLFSIFGSKQASSLREIQQEALSLEELSDLGIKSGVPPDVTLTGSISYLNNNKAINHKALIQTLNISSK